MDLSPREIKAIDIVDRFRIVGGNGERADCTCPNFELRRDFCKLILAVQLVIKREQNPNGSTADTGTLTVSKRITYPKKWTAYNTAQSTEKVNEALCKILCHNLSVLIHEIHQLGIEPFSLQRGIT